MKQLAVVLAVIALAFVGYITNAASAEKTAAKKTVEGELLKIDGESYVIKDDNGKQVRLHVSTDTRKTGDIQIGDRVKAQTDASGRATSIKRQILDPCNLDKNLPQCTK